MSIGSQVPTGTGTHTAGQPVGGEGKPSVRQGHRHLSDNAVGYIFLTPWLIGLVVFLAGPTLVSLGLSFTNYNLLQSPDWIGLQNYVDLFRHDDRYLHSMRVTFVYVLVSVPASLIFALFIAILLNNKIAGIGVYRSIYYVPSLLGGSVAIAILWRRIFGDSGLVSKALEIFGIHGSSWVSSPDRALWTLIILHVWQFGSPMVIFLAGLKQIPSDLYEAASVDGASRLNRFFRITVPMLSPIVLFNLILGIINAFQAFTPAFIVSNGTGGPADSTLFYTLYLYIQGFADFQMGYAAAMAWVLLIIIAAFTALAFASSRFWVFYSDSDS